MKITHFEKAFVLHKRPFTDSSLILDFFTKEHGRINLLAKGARRPKSKLKGVLQPFIPLIISYRGRSDLKTLTDADMEEFYKPLQGLHLTCGLYINELLVRLMHKYDAHPRLFDVYDRAIQALSDGRDIQIALRCFEKAFLADMGYGVDFSRCATTGETIKEDLHYFYENHLGLVKATGSKTSKRLYLGKNLLDIHKNIYGDKSVLSDAKSLMGQMLSQLLGHQIVHSRALMKAQLEA